MKATRRALRRAAGAFTILHQHEWDALQPLAAWATRLFLLLLQFADHKTGAGQATYPLLAECLAPAQPARGPRLFAPTARAVRDMVVELERTRIVARDLAHSSGNTVLFFSVVPRYAEARPKRNSDPKPRPPEKLSKQGVARPAALPTEKLRPQTPTPLQESTSLHMESASYPHVDKSKAELKRVRNEIAARRRGVEK